MTQEPLRLMQIKEGVLIPIKAQPGSRRDEFKGLHDGHLKVAVTAAPEKGKANRAILTFLARKLEIKKSELSLHAGEASTQKKILLEGYTLAEATSKIERLRNLPQDD